MRDFLPDVMMNWISDCLAYPNPYPLNIDYWIHVQGPEQTRIIVQFQRIDLEAQDECLYDYISIQDQEIGSKLHLEPGNRVDAVDLGTLADSITPEEARISYSSTRKKRSPAKISINWYDGKDTDAELQQRTLELRNGYYLTRNNAQSFLPYVRWCGTHESNMSKFDFVAQSNEIHLNFHSDYSINGIGFAAIWKAIDITSCPSRTLTSRDGVIFSPNYPYFLLNNLKCVFVLRAPIDRQVWLEFNVYDLENDALIEVDIGKGYFVPFQSPQQYNDGLFVSLKEQMRVQLRTGQNPRGRGFHATYHTGRHILITPKNYYCIPP